MRFNPFFFTSLIPSSLPVILKTERLTNELRKTYNMKNLSLLILFLQFSLISCSQDTKEIFNRAVELKKNGKYKEALSEYDKVLLIKPNFVNALINRVY